MFLVVTSTWTPARQLKLNMFKTKLRTYSSETCFPYYAPCKSHQHHYSTICPIQKHSSLFIPSSKQFFSNLQDSTSLIAYFLGILVIKHLLDTYTFWVIGIFNNETSVAYLRNPVEMVRWKEALRNCPVHASISSSVLELDNLMRFF